MFVRYERLEVVMLSLSDVTNSLIGRAVWLGDNNLRYKNQKNSTLY